jgi:hypothetical protein
MRTAEQLESMKAHPSSHVDDASGHVDGDTPVQGSAYKRFFEALEELDDSCMLYGPASLEASISRARVERLRGLATETWRNRQAA